MRAPGPSLAIIGTLFRTEMRMALRDKRTIVAAVLLPLLIMPVMLFGTHKTQQVREQKLQATVCRYAVAGSQSELVRTLLKDTQARLATNAAPAEPRPLASVPIPKAATSSALKIPAPSAPDTPKPPLPPQFTEVATADPKAALAKGEIHLILEGLSPAEARGQARKDKTSPTKTTDAAVDDDDSMERAGSSTNTPVVRLVFRADRDDSRMGLQRLRQALLDTRQAQRTHILKARGFTLAPEQLARLDESNLASQGHVAGLALGRMLSVFVIFFIFVGGAVVASDLLAGEKERGTLETLLTSGAHRQEIVLAKHLVILAVALLITLIQALNLLLYVGLKLIPVPAHLGAAVPLGVIVLLVALYLPVAALAASVLLLISGAARSYKEAQLYFLPALLLGLLPALAPLLPGLSLRSALALVPVANIALAVKEILIGSFDWAMIALTWLLTLATAAWTTRWSVRFLSQERLITAADTDAAEFAGGPALFERHVLRWFAVLWALLLIVNGFIGEADLRAQILINVVGLFFGASLLMLRCYRLEPRAALALRAPKPAIWLAVLCGIPGGLLSGIGLFRLANLVMPVSPKVMEAFGQALAPKDIPLAQLFFFLAVLPGIFEELTFRGMLLHGLHRRLRPLPLALAVGLAFGLFHVSLFRLAPTAWLGFVFALTTLLTGSIFPTMLWHAGNNALGILAVKLQIPLEDLEPSAYVAGALLLAAAFWVLARNRTPYPGLKRPGRARSPGASPAGSRAIGAPGRRALP